MREWEPVATGRSLLFQVINLNSGHELSVLFH